MNKAAAATRYRAVPARYTEKMATVPTIRRFVAGTCLLALAVAGQLMLRSGYVVLGGIVLLSCSVLFVARFRDHSITRAALELSGGDTFSFGDWFSIGALATAAAFTLSALALLDVEQPSLAFWRLYSLGLIVLIAGPVAVLVVAWTRRTGRGSSSIMYWLLAILGIAAAVRFVGLTRLPFGTWYDEAANGLEALRIINEPAYRPIYTDGVNASGHYLYLIVAAFKLMGVQTESIRMISAVAGVATVVAAYVAGRELFGRSIGLVFAFMLAVSRWSINFSRLGMYNALTPLFELSVIAFLARGLRRRRQADFVLAGVSLGLGFCFYAAFQLFALALLLFAAYLVIVRWPFAKQVWIGLLMMGLSALIVVTPIVAYAVERPDSYFARVQDTSLLAREEPADRVPALAANLGKHLLMFNVRGDPNGRHNLPGEPMLAPAIAVLFVIGVLLSISRVRHPISVLLLLWFVLALMGGVLSLDFEAPQSLRSIAALPAVYLLAALPLFVLQEEWSTGGGRYYPQIGVCLICLFILPSAFYNLDTYFRRQAQDFASWNAFSTPETLTASVLRELGPNDSAHVISFYDQHPTVRFLARDAVPYERLETTASMPVVDSSDGDLIFILDAERRDMFEEALRVYPGAAYDEVRPPFGGPVILYVVNVPKDVRERVRGFTAVYTSSAEEELRITRGDDQIDFAWPQDAPMSEPFSVEWSGVLAAEAYGPYQFALEAPAAATLFLNESVILSQTEKGEASGTVILPSGLHQIRILAHSGEGPVRLRWNSPDRETEIVPEWVVFREPVSANGLLGRYYANGDWAGEPALEQIDRGFDMYFHIPSLPRPYTVEWTGKIAIPESGTYWFGVASNDESSLQIDGREVASSEGDGEYNEGPVEISAGLHDILIRFADRTHHTFLSLYWRIPSATGDMVSGRQVIPDEVLVPPQGNYERIAIPSLDELAPRTAESPSVSGLDAMGTLEAAAVTVVSGLDQPSGIATVDDGVVVALPNDIRVVAFNSTGTRLREFVPGDLEFDEPFDVIADVQGNIYVLDSGTGTVYVFDSDGTLEGDLKLDDSAAHRARGIGIDEKEGVWIASTPQGTVLRYDTVDASVLSTPVKQHLASAGEAQPVDVAVVGEDMYVTDAGVHKLSRYTDTGMRVWSIDIPVANSLHGSHLAVGPSGEIYITEPELGTVAEVDAGGTVSHRWRLATEDGSRAKPVGIAVDDDGAIWLTDVEGGRILRFLPHEGGGGTEEGR